MTPGEARIHLFRLVRFGAVGVVATLTHLGVLAAGIAFGGLAPALANPLAWVAALPVAYLGHYHVTWGATGAHGALARRFALTMLVALAASQGAVLAIGALGLDWGWALPLIVAVTPLATYTALHLGVFGREPRR